MKKVFNTRIAILFSILIALFVSCKKDSAPPLPSETFAIYNYSSGTSVPAGNFKLQKLHDGNTSVSIQLNNNYRVPGVILNAYITTADTSSLIYASLGTVNGTTGLGVVSLLKTDGDNQPVKYDSLLAKKNYTVKVLNNSNVQAIGAIE